MRRFNINPREILQTNNAVIENVQHNSLFQLPLESELFRKVLPNKKTLNPKLMENVLSKNVNWSFGTTVDNGDCFYDGVAQALNSISLNNNNHYSIKTLRVACSNFMYLLHEKSPNKNWIKEAIEKNKGIDDYEAHLATVQYTQEEMMKFKEESNAFTGNAIGGKPHIEGRILADFLNVIIHLIEFDDNENSMVPIELTHSLITKNSIKKVDKNSVNYNDTNLIHLAMYRNHFVPMLSSPSIEQSQEMTPFDEYFSSEQKTSSSVLQRNKKQKLENFNQSATQEESESLIKLLKIIDRFAPTLTFEQKKTIADNVKKELEQSKEEDVFYVVNNVLNKSFPEEYEYLKEHFYEFAYPEYTFIDEHLDILPYQDLYDVGYSNEFINLLISKIKKEHLEQTKKPEDTEIVVTDVNMLPFDQYVYNSTLKLITDIHDPFCNNHKIKKLIVFIPLSIDNHAHTLVVHIEINNKIAIKIILKNPYGSNHSFELKAQEVFDDLHDTLRKIFKDEEDEKIEFAFQNVPYDMQGFFYDYSNCGALTVYCIEKYLEAALLDKPPEEYKINVVFDQLPNLKLNESLHKAFILRLKADHLNKVGNDNYPLGFQSAKTTNYIDKVRENNARKIANELLKEIYNKAIEKYQKFISDTHRNLIMKLEISKAMKLFNLITNDIISYRVDNIISFYQFSFQLKMILDNYFNLQPPLTNEEIAMSRRALDAYLFNYSTIFYPFNETKEKTKDALERAALSANNLEDFLKLLELAKKEANFTVRITQLLIKILTDNLIYPDKYQVQYVINSDKPTSVSILNKIITALLNEGADPFAKNITRRTIDSGSLRVLAELSSIELAAQLAPSFSEIILSFFPHSINAIFINATKYKNLNLITFLLNKKNISIEKNTLEKAIEIAKEYAQTISPPYMPLDARDPKFFQEVRTAPSKISIIEKLIREKIATKNNTVVLPSSTKNLYMQLFDAIKSGNIKKVVELVSDPNKIKNINMQDEDGFNALGLALECKATEIAVYLINNGAEFNQPIFDVLPLQVAIEHNDVDFLNSVFKNVSKPDLINDNFEYLLNFTAMFNLFHSMEWLVIHTSLSQNQKCESLLKAMGIIDRYPTHQEVVKWIKLYIKENYSNELNDILLKSNKKIEIINSIPFTLWSKSTKPELNQKQIRKNYEEEFQEIFQTQLPNANQFVKFKKEVVKGDGNCGLTALGTDRNIFAKALLSLVKDQTARESLYEEIYQAFISNEVKPYSDELNKLLESRIKLQLEWDKIIRNIREKIPETQKFEGHQKTELMKWLTENGHQQIADQLSKKELEIFQADEELQRYCCSKEVFTYYVNAFLSEESRLWIGHASALLFAEATNITVYIWEQSDKNSAQLALKNSYIATNPKNTIHLFYPIGSNHFDLLTEVESSKKLDEVTQTEVPQKSFFK